MVNTRRLSVPVSPIGAYTMSLFGEYQHYQPRILGEKYRRDVFGTALSPNGTGAATVHTDGGESRIKSRAGGAKNFKKRTSTNPH